ncbi:MAG: PAS domain S-box protein [Chloroflexi bacterium]|nr:MAG: PAS domain S-box protein [Chloroflexota bacterium]
MIATDTNYTTLSWNETAEKLYGWKAEEVLGKTIDTVLQTVFLDSTREEASQQLRGNGYWKGEVLQLRKDGTRRLILSSVVLIKDGSGKIMGAVAANRDIPALKSSASMIVSDR